ncbi:MAG: adenosylcobalamin-dependent ribonucleoside-diphosphate reductase [Phycisphaeraceae bacterium]|nr:adenosylcobalamin-dependent ribonucleoside-diphosphate reductase [Phycisphaeraceae bacterium]MBX3407060.1 adenosylcobalamin-dependent ribonucleoside-diphosphate reductase [Phycisphaeraceae bacterium]
MKITRKFTTTGQDPFASVKWVKRSSKITNPDGSVVFQMDDAEVPETWSQLATDIMVSKYFRKAGVPQPDGATGPEKSARQVIHRLAGCWRQWGEKHGYFDSPNDAKAFYDEMVHMMVHQMAAPNSPQWFNTGLNFAYGISGPAQGHFVPDPKTGKVNLAKDAYTHPQPHACFIQSVDDDLVNEGGIMDLWVREARLFKYGSGTGTNFSRLRGEDEKLSGGGRSSGLMSWLKIGDRAAGAIKSGGTTRRAAKMVCLDMDHPDIEKFINWKVREEIKVQAMVEGLKVIADKKAAAADSQTIGETAKRLGLKLDYDFNGEAYATVSGQNSNNSVRISDEFFDAMDSESGQWQTFSRTTGKPAKMYNARELWEQISYAAWRCADPGVQFDSTINAWHTCPGAGRINASNPCSEYMFLDNTACNLASLNVLKFYDPATRAFDVDRYEHAIDLWTVVLEISVLMASYPSKEVAQLSWKYRTLGLGYANFGALAMQAGIPYDSDEARALCACLTAILTGRAYRMSAHMAAKLGPFPGYEPERESMLRVIRNHRLAAHGVPRTADNFDGLRIPPVPIDHTVINSGRVNLSNADDLLDHAVRAWDEALALGEKHGYRNAQTTVIAPTGTIGLLMDCDTTGIEPDFALVKFKKLAGGGYFKIANASVEPALRALGYSEEHIRAIMAHLLGTLTLDAPMPADAPGVSGGMTFKSWLRAHGLNDGDLEKIEESLPGVFDLSFAFSAFALGDDALRRAGVDPEEARADSSFNLLARLGLSRGQVASLGDVICGMGTVEGAAHLRPEHLPVFDCANKCGKHGQRFIAAEGHIRAMAAAQPFISGAISKTINLPNEATVDDIKRCYRLSWELGLKANALYRDGCKLSQPLSSRSDEKEEEKPEAGKAAAASPSVPSSARVAAGTPAPSIPVPPSEPLVEVKEVVRVLERPMRRRLPETRASITHKFNIAGHEGYLTVGLYEDGQPGELFITMAKEGSTIGGLMDSLGTAVSVALQYGVPVESLVRKFTHQRFEPAGMTTNRDIPFAKSLVDYIFRWMGMEFIPGYREENSPKRGAEPAPLLIDSDDDDAPLEAGHRMGAGRMSAHMDDDRREVKEDTHPWNASNNAEPPPQPAASADAGTMHGHHEQPAQVHAQSRSVSVTTVVEAAQPGPMGAAAVARRVASRTTVTASSSSFSVAMQNAQADAPACDSCGAITVRSGTCYKCLNCGASMGCS